MDIYTVVILVSVSTPSAEGLQCLQIGVAIAVTDDEDYKILLSRFVNIIIIFEFSIYNDICVSFCLNKYLLRTCVLFKYIQQSGDI